MTQTFVKAQVRQATECDDLRPLLGAYARGLNYEQILVVDSGETIEGMLVLFDGGHEQIRVDHLQVLPTAHPQTRARLVEGLFEYCRGRGIAEIVFCTTSTEFAVQAKLRGGEVSSPMFTVTFPVPEE